MLATIGTANQSTNSRILSKLNIEDFKLDLMGQKWTDFYQLKSVDEMAGFLDKTLGTVLDSYIPRKIRTKKLGKGDSKLSDQCLENIKERNKLRKKAKLSGSDEDWMMWRKVRNRVNNMVRDERNNCDKISMFLAEEDLTCKKMWDKVKQLAGWVNSLSPNGLLCEGIITTSPKKMAGILNEYFVTKIEFMPLQLLKNFISTSYICKNDKSFLNLSS